jgi:hypothetical protein
MRLRWFFLVCASLPLLNACMAMNSAPHAGQPTLQGESMQHMLADVTAIRAYVYGSGTLSDANAAATDLVAWSQRMAELFPLGQASTDYVDMSPARVRGAPAAIQQTSQVLLATVRGGSRPEIGSQLEVTERDGCGFCHLSRSR